jgi:hypothetical protein
VVVITVVKGQNIIKDAAILGQLRQKDWEEKLSEASSNNANSADVKNAWLICGVTLPNLKNAS